MNDTFSTAATAQHCNGCRYWKKLFYRGGTHEAPTRACHYMLDTGRRRGSSVLNCAKKTIMGGIQA